LVHRSNAGFDARIYRPREKENIPMAELATVFQAEAIFRYIESYQKKGIIIIVFVYYGI